MPDLPIDFGQLLRDEPAFRSPGVLRALNLVPRSSSFGPMRKLTALSSNALDARALGGVAARDSSGNVYIYAGNATKLYELVDNAWTDESKGGGYSTTTDDVWEFAVWYDSDKVIATNYTDAVQAIAIGGGSAGAFADLFTSTNKPKAKHIGIIGRFLVLGYTNDSTDGVQSSRLWWSGIGDELDMDPDAATQSDFEDIAAGGAVQKIIGGSQYGLAFLEDSVNSMRYTGYGSIFDINPVNFAPGTPIPNSVRAFRGQVFYVSESGFHALRGTQVEHIGNRRVDRAFWREFDIGNKRYVSSAIDPVNKVYALAYPGEGASGDLPNRLLMCKYDENRWAEAEIDSELLLATRTQGYTLDGLDTLGTDIDDAGVFDESLDSDKWKGGAIGFGAFDHSHQLGQFNGPTLAATLVTGDMQPVEGRNWQINGVTPHVDGGDVRVSIAKRPRLQDAVVYGPTSDMNVNGVCPTRSEGKYQRVQFSLSSSTSWSHFQGAGIDYVLTGER